MSDATITRVRPGAVLPRGPGGPGTAYLTILAGEAAGAIVSLHKRRIGLGRGENADIRVRGDTISRNHAQFEIDVDGFVKIVDIGSRNGTYVNGAAIRSEVLRDGDRVALGGDLLVDVRYGRPGVRSFGAPSSGLRTCHLSGPANPSFEHTEAVYEALVRTREQRLGRQHPAVATALEALASIYCHEAKADKALAAYERIVDIQEMVAGIRKAERGHTLIRRGRCLLMLGRFKDAAASLETGHELLESAPPQRGELFEYHIVWACLLDLQGAAGADEHLEKARELVGEPGQIFGAAKDALLAETLRLFVGTPRASSE